MPLVSDLSAVKTYCYQRQLKMMFHTPLTRFELQSPYPQWTKDQLDMRRKVEILKRSSPPSMGGSKGNALTKAQKFALLVRGSLQSVTNTAVTNSCTTISTPSSSSDVPGPTVMLYNDPSVPLYHFVASTRSFAFLDDVPTTPYVFHVTNTDWNRGTTNRLGVLEIINETSEYFSFSLEIPLVHSFSTLPTLEVTYAQSTVSLAPTITSTNTTLSISNIVLLTVNGYLYEFFLSSAEAFSLSSSSPVKITSSIVSF